MTSKYHNQPVVLGDGQRFDSTGEANRWAALRIAEHAGFIRNLRRQQVCVLQDGPRTEAITLRWDFAYEAAGDGGTGVPLWAEYREDFKGMVTPLFKLKLKLHRRVHPHERVVLSTRKGAVEL